MSPETIANLIKGCTKEQIEKLMKLYLKETPYDFTLLTRSVTQLSLFETESLH